MRRLVGTIATSLLLAGCTVSTPKYDYLPKEPQTVNLQGVDIETAVYEVLTIKSRTDNYCYHIRPGDYRKIGRLPLLDNSGSLPLYDDKGVKQGTLCDFVHGLTIYKGEVCIVTVAEFIECFDTNDFEVTEKRLPVN